MLELKSLLLTTYRVLMIIFQFITILKYYE